MKACIFEHAERIQSTHTPARASGKSVAIVCSKVSSVLSGGRLSCRSEGGADDYCSVFLDSGQEILVCGTPEIVYNCLGIDADI